MIARFMSFYKPGVTRSAEGSGRASEAGRSRDAAEAAGELGRGRTGFESAGLLAVLGRGMGEGVGPCASVGRVRGRGGRGRGLGYRAGFQKLLGWFGFSYFSGFPFLSFLFQTNSNLIEFKSNLNSNPMHSTK